LKGCVGVTVWDFDDKVTIAIPSRKLLNEFLSTHGFLPHFPVLARLASWMRI